MKANDRIVIADTELENGDEFMDNLSINAGDNPVVFLVRGNDSITVRGRVYPVYHFTARFVSKMSLLPNLTLAPLSVRRSYVADQTRAKRIDTILNDLSPGAVVNGIYRENIFLEGLLRNAGIMNVADQSSYVRTLTLAHDSVLKSFAARDSRARHL